MNPRGSAPFTRLVVALAVTLSLLALPAGAAAATQPPYQVTFDSTMVNQFAGLDNEPSGSETTEIKATIDLSKQSSGSYTGSATGTLRPGDRDDHRVVPVGDNTTGTTTETELSGNPTTFSATYTPGAERLRRQL